MGGCEKWEAGGWMGENQKFNYGGTSQINQNVFFLLKVLCVGWWKFFFANKQTFKSYIGKRERHVAPRLLSETYKFFFLFLNRTWLNWRTKKFPNVIIIINWRRPIPAIHYSVQQSM